MDKNLLKKEFFTHSGKIFSNLAIAGTVVSLFSVLFTVLGALFVLCYYLFAFIIALATLFTVLINNPNWFSIISFDNFGAYSNFMLSYVAPPAVAVALACSILSIVFLCLGDKAKVKGRIIFSSVVLGLTLILLVALLIQLGGSR